MIGVVVVVAGVLSIGEMLVDFAVVDTVAGEIVGFTTVAVVVVACVLLSVLKNGNAAEMNAPVNINKITNNISKQ